MKKLLVLIAGIVAAGAITTTVLAADKDKPIRMKELPKAAQQFVSKYFSSQKVAMTMKDSEIVETTYDVVFTNGDKVEFNSKGEWKEVKTKTNAVPSGIVPTPIIELIAANYPDVKIMGIEKHRNHYEVELSGGWEIKFDLNFNVIELDD